MSARGPGKRCGHSIDTLWEQPAVAATSPLPPYKPPAGMSAPLPRVKVHEDGRVAVLGTETTVAVSPDGWYVEGDADVSGPGWQDAAIVLPLDLAGLAAELAEVLYDQAHEHCDSEGCAGGGLNYYVDLVHAWLMPIIRERHQSGTVADG